MANFYSNLYELAPYRGQQSFLARSPNVDHRAGDIAEFITFNIPTGTVLGIGDVIHLIPSTPSGFRLTRFSITNPGYDSSTTLVFNLGFLSQAAGAGVLSAQTFLRAAATTSLTDAQTIAASAAVGPQTTTLNLLPAGANDELVFVVTTAATGAGTNGISTCLFEAIFP